MDEYLERFQSRLEAEFTHTAKGEPRKAVTGQLPRNIIRHRDAFPNVVRAADTLFGIWAPPCLRGNPHLSVDYGVVKPGQFSYRRSEKSPMGGDARHRSLHRWQPPTPPGNPYLWFAHLLGRQGLVILWSQCQLHDALFLDVDLRDLKTGGSLAFDACQPAVRAKLMLPVVTAVASLSEASGTPLRPIYYTSGHAGYWVCVPLERPIPKAHAGSWVAEIVEGAHDEGLPFGVGYEFEIGNTFPRCVRIPLGPHDETGRPALFLDPETGEYVADQFEALLGIERSGIIDEEWLRSCRPQASTDENPIPSTPSQTNPLSRAGCRTISGWLGDEASGVEGDAPSSESASSTDSLTTAEVHPFPDKPWHGLLPPHIAPGTTHLTLIDGGLLLRLEARLLHRGMLHWDGSWQHCLDELVDDILSLYPDVRSGRRRQIENYIHCDLEKVRAGTWHGVDTTAGAIQAEEAERCRELAAEIVATCPRLAVGDVTAVLVQLVRCHHVNSYYHRTPFWSRSTLAQWCGFVPSGATVTEAESQAKRSDRIVQRIREDVDGCVKPLIRRTRRGSTGRASEYRFLWANWGGVFASYATSGGASGDQGGWWGSG